MLEFNKTFTLLKITDAQDPNNNTLHPSVNLKYVYFNINGEEIRLLTSSHPFSVFNYNIVDDRRELKLNAPIRARIKVDSSEHILNFTVKGKIDVETSDVNLSIDAISINSLATDGFSVDTSIILATALGYDLDFKRMNDISAKE